MVLGSGKPPWEVVPEEFTIGDILAMEQDTKYEAYSPFSVIFAMFGKGKPDMYNPYKPDTSPVDMTWEQMKRILK